MSLCVGLMLTTQLCFHPYHKEHTSRLTLLMRIDPETDIKLPSNAGCHNVHGDQSSRPPEQEQRRFSASRNG